jgi:predicted HTH transcriptional regulator
MVLLLSYMKNAPNGLSISVLGCLINKSLRAYNTGGEPELIEGDVFKTMVPLSLSGTHVSGSDHVSDKTSDNAYMSDKPPHDILLAYLLINGEVTANDAAKIIGKSDRTARRALQQLVDSGEAVAIGANRNRKYKTVK